MIVLIVEDDKGKERQIASVVRDRFPQAAVVERLSYQSGLAEAIRTRPDIILLDMSLPTYDTNPTEGETGGQPRPYGGRDLLRELSRKRVPSYVIVVTQYDVFGEGENVMSLEQLKANLASQFPRNYLAAVYYQEGQSNWRGELVDALERWAEFRKDR